MASTSAEEEELNSDSDGDESSDREGEESNVQLGFAEKNEVVMFSEREWSTWDGGKIGGKPFWLDPVHVPSAQDLSCEACTEPLSFLLQLYCPLDEEPTAFHRMLYLFCCRHGACAERQLPVALRCQLPRANRFYAHGSTEPAPEPLASQAKLCAVCGQKGPLVCSACKGESYCSKAHQKLAWKAGGHKTHCSGASGGSAPRPHRYACLFPEYEVSVVSESELKEEEEEAVQAAAVEMPQAANEEERKEMATMRQKDIVARDGVDQTAMKDPLTFKFLMETSLAKKQVLRYDRWPKDGKEAALWVKTEGKAEALPPPCERCGEPRSFECQVMPQLLHYLEQDRAAEEVSRDAKKMEALKLLSAASLDWGVLVVSTCTKSCGSSEPPAAPSQSYVKEHVFRQGPL